MNHFKKSIISKNRIFQLGLTLLLTAFSASAQQVTWKVDPSHSKINFGISYFKVGEIKGVFEAYSGVFNEEKNEITEMNIMIKTASINTNQEVRDKHLKTKDFFDAVAYPEITFISKSITIINENEYEVKGDFTMTGITKSIVLKIIDKGDFIHPRLKKTIKIATVSGIINREDFMVGTNYPPAKFALGTEVNLTAEIHLIKQE